MKNKQKQERAELKKSCPKNSSSRAANYTFIRTEYRHRG